MSADSAGTTGAYQWIDIGWYADANATNAITGITAPTKSGFSFGGYWTNADGTGTQIIDEDGDFVNGSEGFTLSGTTVYAEWTEESQCSIAYTLINGGTEYAVTGVSNITSTSIVIPLMYNGKYVTAIGNYAFAGCANLISITLPWSIDSIGDYAFSGCESLEYIELYATMSYVGYHAFEGCYSLYIYIYYESYWTENWNEEWNPDNCYIEWESW